jgi:hypothetical protein
MNGQRPETQSKKDAKGKENIHRLKLEDDAMKRKEAEKKNI